jgi:hypothetical protein
MIHAMQLPLHQLQLITLQVLYLITHTSCAHQYLVHASIRIAVDLKRASA